MNGVLLVLAVAAFVLGLLMSLSDKPLAQRYWPTALFAGLACWALEVAHVYFHNHH